MRHGWIVETWPVFRGRGVTRAGPRGGPLGMSVPSEGESAFTFVGTFIPNVFFSLLFADGLIPYERKMGCCLVCCTVCTFLCPGQGSRLGSRFLGR